MLFQNYISTILTHRSRDINPARSTSLLPWLGQKWRAVKILIAKLFLSNYVSTKHLAREKRTEGLTKFILTLSDQQLVTGLAVLIGSLSNR